MYYIKLLLIPALFSWLLGPLVIRAAQRWEFFDYPEKRKVHATEKPCLGGLVIFVAFVAGGLLLTSVDLRLLLILAGGVFYFVLGLADDRYNLSPRFKFVIELLVTLVVVLIGMHVGLLLDNPFGSIGANSMLAWFSVPFSVLWIVGVANAVNLIDGLDALASGVVIIACAVMAVAAVLNSAILLSPLLLVLLGSLIGYIKFNFYPSRIIMGDSGSLFVGYAVAIISLSSFAVPDRSIFLSIIPAAMALFVPIFDTFSAIIRRGRCGKRIFSADNNHIHHYLLHLGFSHPQAVKILWAFSLAFGGVAVLLSELIYRQIVLAIALLVVILGWVVFSAIVMGLFSNSQSVEEELPAASKVAASNDS